MFALVGRAITSWSIVEKSLCNILVVCCCSCPTREDGSEGIVMLDPSVPMAVFYSVENFRSKLGIVDSAIRARVHEHGQWAGDIRENWAKLHEKTRKLSLKRNRLAHWTVIPPIYDEIYYGPRLMPPYGSPAWYQETGWNPKGSSLSYNQVSHLCHAFDLLDCKLSDFCQSLAHHPTLQRKYDELTARQIRTLAQLSPTRVESIKRAISSEE